MAAGGGAKPPRPTAGYGLKLESDKGSTPPPPVVVDVVGVVELKMGVADEKMGGPEEEEWAVGGALVLLLKPCNKTKKCLICNFYLQKYSMD